MSAGDTLFQASWARAVLFLGDSGKKIVRVRESYRRLGHWITFESGAATLGVCSISRARNVVRRMRKQAPAWVFAVIPTRLKAGHERLCHDMYLVGYRNHQCAWSKIVFTW